MWTCVTARLSSRHGITVAVLGMSLLLLAMLVVISMPAAGYFQQRSEALGCVSTLDTSRRQLAADYLGGNYDMTAEEARDIVERAMVGWTDLCPGGGNVYVVEADNNGLPFDLVCGLHGKDAAQRTRLNAANVLEQLQEAVRRVQQKEGTVPERVSVMLNGELLEVVLVEQDVGLKRGTGSTSGYKGTVAYFGLTGQGDFPVSKHSPERTVCYLSFADENFCANWNSDQGWSGSAYSSQSYSGSR